MSLVLLLDYNLEDNQDNGSDLDKNCYQGIQRVLYSRDPGGKGCGHNQFLDIYHTRDVDCTGDIYLGRDIQLALDIHLGPDIHFDPDTDLAPNIRLDPDIYLSPDIRLNPDIQPAPDTLFVLGICRTQDSGHLQGSGIHQHSTRADSKIAADIGQESPVCRSIYSYIRIYILTF